MKEPSSYPTYITVILTLTYVTIIMGYLGPCVNVITAIRSLHYVCYSGKKGPPYKTVIMAIFGTPYINVTKAMYWPSYLTF